MSQTYRIGELSQQLEVPVETIRYYEREQLLPSPARTSGNYRVYSETQRERLSFIRHCRSLDMTLEEIRELLRLKDFPRESCAEVNALLDSHISHVEVRIEELHRLKIQLKRLRSRCDSIRAGKDCKILEGLTRGAGSAQRRRGRTGQFGV